MELSQLRRTAHIDLARLFQQASVVWGGVVILIGAIVLLGWWLDLPFMAGSFATDLAPISLQSAIAFIAAGFSLIGLHLHWHSKVALRGSQVLAIAVLLLGLLELGETELHWQVDQWLAQNLLHSPSWMAQEWIAPSTGMNFVLIGNALLLSGRPERWVRRIAQLLTLITALVAVHSLLNNIHPIGLMPAHSVPSMALMTALTFLILGAGIQAFHLDEAVMRLVRISEGSSEGMVCQLILAAIALSVIEAFVMLWKQPQTTGDTVFNLSFLTIKTVFIFTLLIGWGISLLSQIRQDYQEAEVVVDESLSWFQLAQEAASLGRWHWDLVSNEMHWCQIQKQLFGLTPDIFGGHYNDFLNCLHPDDRTCVQQVLERAIANQQDYFDEFRIVWPDGSVHWILAKGHCFCNTAGKVIGISGVSLDITEHQQFQEERNHLLHLEQVAHAKAEAANRMKDEFLSILSHEVRTPLNSVLGWAQLLRTRSLKPTLATQGIESLERNAQAQAQILEEMLDMARVVQGKLQLQLQPTNLNAVVDSAVDIIRPAAEAKQIRIYTHFDAFIHRFLGDAERLRQIVWNLLSNAVKFTPPQGRIDITLTQNNNEVQISVSDTGSGISPEFLPYVFDRFRQEDSSSTRKYGGLGLGLALVRYLVELHGGTVEATSEGIGQGATFTVKLPLRA